MEFKLNRPNYPDVAMLYCCCYCCCCNNSSTQWIGAKIRCLIQSGRICWTYWSCSDQLRTTSSHIKRHGGLFSPFRLFAQRRFSLLNKLLHFSIWFKVHMCISSVGSHFYFAWCGKNISYSSIAFKLQTNAMHSDLLGWYWWLAKQINLIGSHQVGAFKNHK